MKVIYLDANIIIRWIEGDFAARNPLIPKLTPFFGQRNSFVTSHLTRLECRTKPIKMKDPYTLDLFDRFFASIEVQMVSVDESVIDLATEFRANYGFKTPDAIHLATARISNVTKFLTGDQALSRCIDVPVEIM